MIEDIDASLRTLIRRDVLSGRSHADISFEVPGREWAYDLESPTIGLYLYGVHEEASSPLRLDDLLESCGQHRPPGRRLSLSYLVTVWADLAEDEHRLLSALLACFLGHDVLPAEVLTPRLRKHPSPCELRVTLPAQDSRRRADVVLARDLEVRPSLDLAVVVPVSLAGAHKADLDYREQVALVSAPGPR